MIRQYHAQRHRRIEIGGRVRAVGTIPVGTIALVQCRKIRVEAWLPREYAAVERGRFVTKRIAGGHLAQVRDLATGRVGPSLGRLPGRRRRDRDRGTERSRLAPPRPDARPGQQCHGPVNGSPKTADPFVSLLERVPP